MNQKKLLLVCLDVEDFKKISKIDLSNFSEVVVASDNIKVHKECKKLKIYKTTFLQKPISYTKISKNVLGMTDKVNIYLSRVAEAGIFNKTELLWDYHVEGGYTTQRLQDVLIAIECAYRIFDEYEINEIIIIGYNNHIETNILRKLAPVKGCKISFYNSKPRIDQNKIKDFFRPFYYLIKSLVFKIKSKKLNFLKKHNIVLFQMCHAVPSYVENILFPQNELKKNGLTPVNLVWGNTNEVKRIIDKGHNAVAGEYYLKYSDIFKSLYKIILIFINFKSLKNKFYEESFFKYRDIDVADIVFDSIYKYLYTDGPENYRYRVATQRFTKEYSEYFVAIKHCAAKFLKRGSILSEIIEDKYLKFEYSLGFNFEHEYTKHIIKKNYDFLNNKFIRFVFNEIDKKQLVNNLNFSNDSVIVFGSGRFNKHFNNVKNLSKSESKKKIGIKKEYDIYLLLDLQAPVTGYISVEEIIYLLNILINTAKEHPNLALIIKPYPSVDISLLSEIANTKTNNVFLIEKNSLPDDALNVADVIFTKFSTMGVESMIYNAQVVSVHYNKDKANEIYGDAAEYIYGGEKLNEFLKYTFNSKSNFIIWKNSFKERRENFIQKYFPKLEKSSDKILADEIIKNIKTP